MAAHRLTAADIGAIVVGVGHMTYVHTAWPYAPAGITAAQMNMFYGLAVMARQGNVSVEDFTEDRLADPALLDFMRRITIAEDEAINARGRAARHGCVMTVTTTAGAIFRETVLDRRGSPENPVSAASVIEKFHANVADCLGRDHAEQVANLVDRLEQLDSLAGLTALLAQAGRA